MSEKPFWEGKTCKEMAGLHVKVTYENGDVLTGVTDEDGDIEYAYTLSDGSVDDKFIPRDFIESIELVDDPECERIDDIGDVRVGDVYVATDGNEYTVTALNKATADPPLRVAVSDGVCWPRRDYFAYALRPAPKLPDKPGLWLDNEDCVWIYGENNRLVRLIGSEGWQTCYEGMALGNPILRDCARSAQPRLWKYESHVQRKRTFYDGPEKTGMGLSNGLCSNHVGWSQSSRTHSSGAAAQIERPEVRTIACGHRVHNHVLGAGLVAVVPRPIRFGRNFLMDLSNRAVRPPASAVGRKSIA